MSLIPDAISVVIPTYNRAHLIIESLQSVLDQTLQPYEIIVVDDFSTDNTEEIVKSLNSPLIKFVKNSRKKGANGARNTGILMAQGEYIAFHDSDDIWFPKKLEEQYLILKKYTENYICFCSMVSVNAQKQENIIPKRHVSTSMVPKILENRNVISTQTIFMHSKLAKDVLFDEDLKRYQDWDFVLRLIDRNVLVFHLNKILVKQNINETSITQIHNSLDSYYIFLDKHPKLVEKGIVPRAVLYKKRITMKKNPLTILFFVYGVLLSRLNFYRYWY